MLQKMQNNKCLMIRSKTYHLVLKISFIIATLYCAYQWEIYRITISENSGNDPSIFNQQLPEWKKFKLIWGIAALICFICSVYLIGKTFNFKK